MQLSPEEAAAWLAWVEERPPAVAAVCERLPPWHTYRLTTTGQKCRIIKYDEYDDGSLHGPYVTLSIVAWHDWLPIPRGVFGVDPDDLELPLAGAYE